MHFADSLTAQRLEALETHLRRENPILVSAVQDFRQLDKLARRMGLLAPGESYATRITWWPMVAILGTFSAGKSSFINSYLSQTLQRTGNQAVDEKFTVIGYSGNAAIQTLPGSALDADPRFPFYQFSEEIEKVAAGEGKRIDAYLQLKVCPCPVLSGKILIDSPGFDADAQRTSTLRIVDHVIDLSDLVLVFFDARHPEPGAMRDTLKHLVNNTLKRADSEKFLFILNQIDSSAREDNLEDIVAAWQRALGEQGLTAGRFYTVYNADAAPPIADETVRRRLEAKRDNDLAAIQERMQQVGVQRAYRIVNSLERTAQAIERQAVPLLQSVLERWRRWVLGADGLFLALLAGWLWHSNRLPDFSSLWRGEAGTLAYLWLVVLILGIGGVHFSIRRLAAQWVGQALQRDTALPTQGYGDLLAAWRKNTSVWRPLAWPSPLGWGHGARKRLRQLHTRVDKHVQNLNDHYAQPNPPAEGR